MTAQGERPARDLHLMPADASGGEGGFGQELAQLSHLELEDVAPRRKRVLHAHHELHVWRRRDQALGDEVGGVVEHREVEDLDLRPDAEVAHLRREAAHEGRRVLVDDGREVARAGGERGHVGPQVQHRAALLEGSATAAGRELHDDVGTVAADAVLEGGELLGIARVRLVRVADMDVDERSARFDRPRACSRSARRSRSGRRGCRSCAEPSR